MNSARGLRSLTPNQTVNRKLHHTERVTISPCTYTTCKHTNTNRTHQIHIHTRKVEWESIIKQRWTTYWRWQTAPVICKIPGHLHKLWGCFKGLQVTHDELVRMLNMTNETHFLEKMSLCPNQISLHLFILLQVKKSFVYESIPETSAYQANLNLAEQYSITANHHIHIKHRNI